MTVTALRERILAADDLDSEVVDIPEWDNVKLELRVMTGTERAHMVERSKHANPDEKGLDPHKFYPNVLIASCFDPETGARVFTDSDVKALSDKSAAVLERLATRCMELSGLSDAAVKRLGKDSETTPSDASTSSSPSTSE